MKNGGCSKGCLFSFIIIALIIFALFFVDFEMRDYYKVGNMNFTFWKTDKGCYIIPCKYRKLWVPQEDYMLASNTCTIHIYYDNKTLFHVFTENDPPALHDEVEFNLISYKYVYTRAEAVIDMEVYKKMDSLKLLGHPYIGVIIKDLGGITKPH